jgi:hypothetical protein
MGQAVRVGRQILLPGSVHRAKLEFKVWQRYRAQTSGRLAAKDFVPACSPPALMQFEQSGFELMRNEIVKQATKV